MMRRFISTILLFALIFAFPARAQEPVDQSVIARIKTEGFQHSQVMETVFYLTDVHGPRLRRDDRAAIPAHHRLSTGVESGDERRGHGPAGLRRNQLAR